MSKGELTKTTCRGKQVRSALTSARLLAPHLTVMEIGHLHQQHPFVWRSGVAKLAPAHVRPGPLDTLVVAHFFSYLSLHLYQSLSILAGGFATLELHGNVPTLLRVTLVSGTLLPRTTLLIQALKKIENLMVAFIAVYRLRGGAGSVMGSIRGAAVRILRDRTSSLRLRAQQRQAALERPSKALLQSRPRGSPFLT